MMRLGACAFFFSLSVPALAHPGHVAEAAGHSHWLALAALAVAFALVAAGLMRVLRRRRAEAPE